MNEEQSIIYNRQMGKVDKSLTDEVVRNLYKKYYPSNEKCGSITITYINLDNLLSDINSKERNDEIKFLVKEQQESQFPNYDSFTIYSVLPTLCSRGQRVKHYSIKI